MRRLICISAALVIAICHASADEGIAARLGSLDPHVARQAIEDATNRGPDAIPELRAILRDKDKLAAQYAAVALGRINAPGADYALLECLRYRPSGGDPYLTQYASEALAARGEDALPLLRRALGLDRPSLPDPERATRWYEVYNWLMALPGELLNPVLQDYTARSSEMNLAMVGTFFLEQGESGMRLWAESFLRDDPLPTVEEANAAWRQALENGAHDRGALRILAHGGLQPIMHPDPHEIEIGEDRPDYLIDLAWDYARSDQPEQRLWGFSQLLMLVPRSYGDSPREERDQLVRAILTDPHWRIVLLLERDGGLDLDRERVRKLRSELRALLARQVEPVRLLAAEELLEIGDPQAVDFAAECLTELHPEAAAMLARQVLRDGDALPDGDRLRLLEPLLTIVRRQDVPSATNAIGSMPASAWPRVAELLESDDPAVRQDGAWALGQIAAQDATTALIAALDDDAAEVRREALHSLGLILGAQVEPHLKPFVASEYAEDRAAAFRAAYDTEDAALVARVFRRIPADCDIGDWDGLISPHWPPNLPDEVRAMTEEQRWRLETQGRIPRRSPPVLLEAAHEVLVDTTQTELARRKAASLIVWDALERQGGHLYEEDPDRVASDMALVNGDLWPAVEVLLRHPEWHDWNGGGHVSWAIEHIRREEAVPLLAAWARYTPSATIGSFDQETAVTALAQIRSAGVEVILGWLSREDDLRRDVARALAQADVEEAIEPVAELVRQDALPLDALQLFEAERARELIAAIAADRAPGEGDYRDLYALGRAAPEASFEQARLILRQRGDATMRWVAVSRLGHSEAPNDFRLVLRVAKDELELYSTRHRALRAVEKSDPEQARRIAEQWTNDYRFAMRRIGRNVLRGEERYYL